jgi:hypothetical protein
MSLRQILLQHFAAFFVAPETVDAKTEMKFMWLKIGRGDRIRTYDPMRPRRIPAVVEICGFYGF